MLIAKKGYKNTRLCADADGTEGMASETRVQQAQASEKRTGQKYICNCLHLQEEKSLCLCFVPLAVQEKT